MKEQQKHSCSCPVCGRRRIAIEKELEMLYDAYYEELERYAEKGVLAIEVKGGVISHVTDDLMKNEGKKFLDMMEKLAERRMKRQLEKEEHESIHISDDEVDDIDEEDDMTDEQRVEEGKKNVSNVCS